VRSPRRVVLAFLLAGVLTGCGQGTQPVANASAPSTAPGQGASSQATISHDQASPTAASPTAAPPGAIDYDSGQAIAPAARPTWDAASRLAATDAAGALVAAFARPDLDATTWWARLAPLLSTGAQLDYASVDPGTVPAHAVTGAATLTGDTSPLVATVEVPTDAGTYTVVLSRGDDAHPWLGEKIRPPAGTH
jgi:hypothetical protein